MRRFKDKCLISLTFFLLWAIHFIDHSTSYFSYSNKWLMSHFSSKNNVKQWSYWHIPSDLRLNFFKTTSIHFLLKFLQKILFYSIISLQKFFIFEPWFTVNKKTFKIFSQSKVYGLLCKKKTYMCLYYAHKLTKITYFTITWCEISAVSSFPRIQPEANK